MHELALGIDCQEKVPGKDEPGASLPGIIADDFTGAMDTGVQFACAGFPTRLILQNMGREPADQAQVVVINTNSREVADRLAAERCQQAARTLTGRRLFKKIDSTMRGHIGAEIEALLGESGCSRAVICPAAPAQGRIVRDGRLYVHGIPLHESSFCNDPAFPARTSALAELTGRPTTHLPGSVVSQSTPALVAAIAAASTALVTLDAENDEDLARIYLAGCSDSRFILCGSFGLASVWAKSLVRSAVSPRLFGSGALGSGALRSGTLRSGSRVLVIAGSANAAAHAQLQALGGHADVRCWSVDAAISPAEQDLLVRSAEEGAQPGGARITVLHPSAGETLHTPAWRQFSRMASRLGADLLLRLKPDVLLIIGGETANHLCDALAVQAVDLLGEAAPGIPFGRLRGGPADGQMVVSKAGGFGQIDCLETLFYPASD